MTKVKNILTLTLGQGFNTLINILFLPYLARSLSYELYGTYGQTLLVVDIVKTLLFLGLPQIIFVWLADKQKNQNKTIANNIMAGFVAGLVGYLFFLLSSGLFANMFDNVLLTKLIAIYAVSIIFQIPVVNINSILIFKQQVRKNVVVIISGNILKILLVFLSIQLFHSLELVMWSIVIASLFQMLIGFKFIYKDFDYKKLVFSEMFSQVKTGFPLGLTGVVGVALLTTDGFMVSKMLGVKEYAIYRNGAIEVPFIATIYGSIAAIILPEVSKLFAAGEFKKIVELKRKVIKNTAMIIYPIMLYLIIFNTEIITIYLGNMYQASGILFAIYTLSLLIRVNDYSDVLVANKKGQIILASYLVAFSVNIILNIVLIKSFGVIGASISTIVSLFVLAGLQMAKTLKILSIRFLEIYDLFSILKMIILSLAILFILLLLKTWLEGLLLIVVSMAVFFPSIYFILLKIGFLDKKILYGILPNRITKLLKI